MPGIWLWRGRRAEEASRRYLTMRRVCNKLFHLTGFRGKTLWDLMGLLIVPLVILGATWVLNYFEGEREEKRADALQKIENDRVQHSVLQSYIKDMTELLLHEGLAASKPEQPIRDIARSSTITAVRQLDGSRKGILLRFLYESDLIYYEKELRLIPELIINPITALKDADLTNANLNGAILSNAVLSGADLKDADLTNANLNGAILSRAFLSLADLRGTNLTNTNLNGAILSHAILSRAFLSLADLRSAKGWTNEELAQAASLVGATLPDGTKMTEEAWEEFKKHYRQ